LLNVASWQQIAT